MNNLDSLQQLAFESANFENEMGISDFETENFVGKRFGTQAQNRFRAMKNEFKFGTAAGNRPAAAIQGVTQAGQGIERGIASSFTVVARRVTANIAQPLPAVLFGITDRQSGYVKVLTLPAGITLKSLSYGIDSGLTFRDKLVLTYTNGTQDDDIEITAQGNPYPSLLENTRTDIMVTNGIRLTLSDSTRENQFGQDVVVNKISLTGRGVTDNITPAQYKKPEQFQAGIVDLPIAVSIDKETSITQNLIAIANFSVQYTLFNSRFDKFNAQTELNKR